MNLGRSFKDSSLRSSSRKGSLMRNPSNLRLDADGLKSAPAGQARRYMELGHVKRND